jgi:hypothetical protein
MKDPAIAGLWFSLVGRIFTGWSSDQGIIEKVIKRKNERKLLFQELGLYKNWTVFELFNVKFLCALVITPSDP